MAIPRKFRQPLAVGAALAALLIGGIGISQIAFAATLFSDDFQDGDGSGWSKSGGEWFVVTDGTLAFRQTKLDSELARQFAGSSGWTNYTLQARVKPLAYSGSGSFAGIAARSGGSTSFDRLVLLNGGQVQLQAVRSGSVTVLGSASLGVSTGTWYTLRLDVSGSTVRGYVNGAQIGSGGTSQSSTGRIGLQTFHATASFDDVSVTDGTTTPPTSSPTTNPTSTPTTPPTTGPTGPAPTGLVGWATQNGGTTGGAGGSTVTVSSASALTTAIAGTNPSIIRVSGTISCSGMLRVGSNKSILGNSGATIAGCGLTISGQRNVIIRNISFRDWNDDAINVETSSTNVWVDHNSFTNGYDGAVDIKRGSDFITVSWNRIYGHDKSMLLGHSDDNASQDVGHLRVTYHHNWFDGSGTRHPRVRFGNPVHVFNNYYFNNEYGVASTMDAGVLVEGNYFENVAEPTLVGYASSDPGTLVQRNNYFVGSGTPQSAGGVASIPYSYTVETASSIRSVVTGGAGAGRISV